MRFETRAVGVFEVLSVQLVADEVFDAGRLRQETLRLVERGSRRIIIDLGGVEYLYSDSINALVALNRRMLESSGRMGILVPHPKVYDILVRAGLENIMRLYRSEAELQSDSRELMRQSSAWTRPAELLSAATASQMVSPTTLAPKNPGDLRDAASASQRIPRRRVGSRVEVKSRRRGGRGLDQDPVGPDFQLPPQLPVLPSESSTLRALSQDSSSFEHSPPPRPGRTPPPAPAQPKSASEATVFHIPDSSQHDGYSTDAWLLSLTSQQEPPSPSASQMVAQEIAADSSSFLPKVAPGQPPLQDAPSQFSAEFRWDDSAIHPVDTPSTPPPAPRGYAPPPQAYQPPPQTYAPPPAQASPWTSGQQPHPAQPQAPQNRQASQAESPFLNDPRSSYHDVPSAHSSAGSPGSASGVNPRSSVSDPWQPPPFQPLPPDQDIRSAIFYDHAPPPAPNPPPAPKDAAWSDPTMVMPTQAPEARRQASPASSGAHQIPVPPPAAARSGASAMDSWFGGQPATQPPPAPPAPRAAASSTSVHSAAASHTHTSLPTQQQPDLGSWFDNGTPAPAPAPRPAPPQPAPRSQASATDSWISQPSSAPPPSPRSAPPAPRSNPSAQDSWISQSPASARPAPKSGFTPKPAPVPTPAPKPAASPLDSWITQSPVAEKPAPRSTQHHPAPSPARAAEPTAAQDSWITPSPAASPKSSPKRSSPKDSPVGGTAWNDPSPRQGSKRPPPATKPPSSFVDLDDLDAEEPSRRSPLLLALIALAVVAIIGLGIFFLGGAKKNATDVPPGTTSTDSSSVEAAPPPPAEEAPVAETAEEVAAPEPVEEKVVQKPEPKKSKPEPKKTASKETKKPPPAPVAPAPAPEEEHSPIKVFVTSRPSGATLFLDGSKTCKTPCEVTVRRRGQLEFNLAGYRKQTKAVDPEETRGTINVQLVPDGGGSGVGKIYLTSAPTNAEIVVAGKVVGKTPRMVELPVGSQKVTVRSGVLSRSRSLDIQSGTNTAEHFSL
ncbi:MAG TPA: PEGA domain-containing protein [Fibrobacteria bacterium]|nr:PEGA domain-containing protein [Fibrobacteria bacterium]